jgi:predicted RNase H-like HicB family nuclease
MARASVARKPKKKTVRSVRRGTNRFALAPTNTWRDVKYYVHYEVESKEWVTKVKEYIKKTYDKQTVKNINRLPDWRIGAGSHWAAAAHLLMTKPELVPDEYHSGIEQFVANLSEMGSKIAEERADAEADKPKKGYVPSIQERISEQAQDACDAIEEWLEGYITDPAKFDPNGFDFAAHFANNKVTQAHARKIKKYYAGWLEEAELVANMPTPAQIKKMRSDKKADEANQLREGYSGVKKAHAKKWLEALQNLIGACDMLIESSKANRKPRKKKAPSKEKLVAKLKFKEQDDRYQIVSINPLEVLDATELWVFNTKTRKLGKYVADEHAGSLSVKGTTIVGFNEKLSVQKTVRKPDETLREFKKAGKVKLRKFMSEINAVEIKLNGRLNADTVILKAVH